jgi:VCBS repeat-containing protein
LTAFNTSLATSLGLTQTNQTSGDQVYFAGGGGGAITLTYTPGTGGLGGGGAAVTGNNTGTSGTANSGGGGGGTGCCDGGRTGAGGSGIVLIRYVADVTAPTFTNSTTFSIAENTATSTNAATISVNESSTITITSGTDSARFTLVTSDSVTARIRFAATPNFEAPADVGTNNVYDISVRATDTAGNIANQSIAITVTNVNEAPTITVNSSNETHTITQAENISSVLTYTATDVDAATTLSWSLSGTDAADFAINSSSGALTFSSNPDFEAPADSDTNNSYIIIVTVSDGSLTDTQTVTITITNANESASINAPTVSGTINKGIATTITVTINVAGKVRFFVGGKRISTCKDRTTSGTYPNNSATCSWRPAVTGRQILTATLTPTDNTFSASTSAPTTVQVVRRGTVR